MNLTADLRSITTQFFGDEDAPADREGAWFRLAILAVTSVAENTEATKVLIKVQAEKEDSGISLLDRVLRLTEGGYR